MGSYAMKPTSMTVELANGELATVYVYSHKGYNDRAEGQAKSWFRRYGDRVHPWAVMAYRNDGITYIDLDDAAKKIGKRWLVNDDWFADLNTDETSLPVHLPKQRNKLVMTRTVEEPVDANNGCYIEQHLVDGHWVEHRRMTYWCA